MNLSEQLLRTTVRIESDCVVHTEKGDMQGLKTGTGFFFNYSCEIGDVPLLVTNKHVLADVLVTRVLLTLADENGNPTQTMFPLKIAPSDVNWVKHPDPDVDLCAMPIAPIVETMSNMGHTAFFKAFGASDIPNDDQMRNIDAISEILMIGYPDGMWDALNNLPIARRGITATPYHYDYQGRREFLIDCACYGGSSGSPVLLRESGMLRTGGGFQLGGERMHLLGVLYAGPEYRVEGQIAFDTTMPRVEAGIPMNIGVVIKAERIVELARHVVDIKSNGSGGTASA